MPSLGTWEEGLQPAPGTARRLGGERTEATGPGRILEGPPLEKKWPELSVAGLAWGGQGPLIKRERTGTGCGALSQRQDGAWQPGGGVGRTPTDQARAGGSAAVRASGPGRPSPRGRAGSWGRRAGRCPVQLRGAQGPGPEVDIGEVAAEGVVRREAPPPRES